MAEQDFKFDDALLMKTTREMLAKKLTETVKEVAKSGEWEIPTVEQEESDPEKILQRMFAKYATETSRSGSLLRYLRRSMCCLWTRERGLSVFPSCTRQRNGHRLKFG